MLTAIENSNSGNNIGFLLFSLMQNRAELYLTKEAKPVSKKPNTSGLGDIIIKTISKKIGLFRKDAKVEETLDTEIEAAIMGVKLDGEDAIDTLMDDEMAGNPGIVAGYETKPKESNDMAKSALKSLYQIFMSYAKTTYKKIRETVEYGKKKIIEVHVRMTTEKFCKVGQYVNATLTPSWNTPTLSKFDMDTLSVQIANHVVIDGDGIKQNAAYGALMYQVKG